MSTKKIVPNKVAQNRTHHQFQLITSMHIRSGVGVGTRLHPSIPMSLLWNKFFCAKLFVYFLVEHVKWS